MKSWGDEWNDHPVPQGRLNVLLYANWKNALAWLFCFYFAFDGFVVRQNFGEDRFNLGV